MNSTVLLGNYNHYPFQLYMIKNQPFYSLHDINHLFLNNQITSKSALLKSYFKSNPSHFLVEEKGDRIYMMTGTLLKLARAFNAYCLAELCKLSVIDLLAHVAEPLLNTIQDKYWQLQEPEQRELNCAYKSLYGNEWLFITPPSCDTPLVKKSICATAPTITPASNQADKVALLCKWLSTSGNDDPSMKESLILANKVKQQQQAIIEARQRQSSLHHLIPINKKTNKIKKMTTRTTTNRLVLPPSPPTHQHNNKKRKLACHDHHQEAEKKQKIFSGYDNLNLLATQATQMRGLPLSPEVSPSPPPYYQQQRLPSIQAMLSDIHHLY